MKLVKTLFLGMFAVICLQNTVQAQCEVTPYIDNCVQKLKPLQFKFLKSYKLDGLNGKKKAVEYSYVFSKGTTYIITLSNGDPSTKGLVVTLMDSQKNALGSNFDGKKKFLPAIELKCEKTGIYYLSYNFQGSVKEYCGASVLGYKR